MVQSHKILLIDDDTESTDAIVALLTKQHYSVKQINGTGERDMILADEKPHMVIMEIANAAIDGYDLLKDIRRESQIPIIVVSPRDVVIDKVLCLELGADDYIVMPFDESEFLARVKAVFRRSIPGAWVTGMERIEDTLPIEKVIYPGLSINLTDYSVHFQGGVVNMPPKELELFYFLASHPNQVFTREQILDHVWSYNYIGDARTVDVHIKRIRKRFSDHPMWSLETVWGIGYKFVYRETQEPLSQMTKTIPGATGTQPE